MTRRTRWWLWVLLAAGIGAESTAWWQQHRRAIEQRHGLEITLRRVRAIEAECEIARAKLVGQRNAADEHGYAAMPAAENTVSDPMTTRWLVWVHELRGWLEKHPTASVPEFAYLKPVEWVNPQRGGMKVDTAVSEEALRRAASGLRSEASFKFLQEMSDALVLYSAKHAGALPADLTELVPYFAAPPPDGALARYAIVQSGDLRDYGENDSIIETRMLADEMIDYGYEVRGAGMGSDRLRVRFTPSAEMINRVIAQAQRRYQKANERRSATTPEQLAPYLDASDGIVKLRDLQRFWNSPLRAK
jgi:hypothetical protein